MAICSVHVVKNARKAQGKCERCGTELPAGAGYRWWKGRYGPRHVRCLRPSCAPALADLETNPLRADALRAEEMLALAQSSGDAESAASHLSGAIDMAQGLIDALDERISGWSGTNLENSYQYEACESTKSTFEDWVSRAEEVQDQLEEMNALPPEMTDYAGFESPEQSEQDDAQDAYDADTLLYEQALESVWADLDELPELDLGA